MSKATTKLKGAIKLQTILEARSGLVQNISEVNKMPASLTKLITTSLTYLRQGASRGAG